MTGQGDVTAGQSVTEGRDWGVYADEGLELEDARGVGVGGGEEALEVRVEVALESGALLHHHRQHP
eukprot:2325418-Rhodomonas_salina.4